MSTAMWFASNVYVVLYLQAAADEAAWAAKAAERKRLGIGPPLKPTPENQWRLEQMYDDD